MLCCPRCGSTRIFLETGGYTGNIYRCKKCGYRGAFILEIGEEKDRKVPDRDALAGDGKE